MRLLSVIVTSAGLMAQETIEVKAQRVARTIKLPGEFLPYQHVDLHARVTGFVEKVEVDRGSVVKQGQLLVTLSAPEVEAQKAEALAKVQSVEAQRTEAEAKLISAQGTAERMKTAAQTPGAIAGNEVLIAEKAVDAAKALLGSFDNLKKAAEASVKAVEDLQAYLKIYAPFDGVITERFAHPGALAGPQRDPLLRLEQLNRLRLVIAVPEIDVGAMATGGRVSFTVPAFPGEIFHAVIARPARALDPKTRSMAVELDVSNPGRRLAPGMFPEVTWPVRKARPSLVVPPTAIVTTTERTFVVKVDGGKAKWVNVRRGGASGDLVEILGPLKEGDKVIRRATDEIREGTAIR